PPSESSSLLCPRDPPPPPRTASPFAPDQALDSDSEALPATANGAGVKRDYGTTTPASASRHDAARRKRWPSAGGSVSLTDGAPTAFATLPARLSRAASISRKRERDAARTTMWKSLSTRAKYYVPVLHWLPSYTPRKFASDVVAALTLTSMIVPQAMSYSTNLVHSDPVHGLFGVAIPAMIYSVLGTCRQLSLGPEAALSLIMGETIAKFIEAEEHAHGGKMSPADKAKLTVTLTTIITFESGLVTFLLGFFRLGFLDAVLSRALLRGFITAVGLVIFISQLIPILGLEHALAAAHGSYSSIPAKLGFLVTHLGNTHRLTLAVSSAALAVLVGAKAFKRTVARRKGCGWTKFVPEVLLVVLASTFLSHLFRWDRAGLEVLGRISPGAVKIRIPFLGWGHWKTYVHQCLGTATVIAVLGFLDSIVAAKDMASKFDYPISPNRELTALGVANLSNSLFTGSLPGFGSITRSRLAAATGATTQMAGLLTGTFVLLVTYFLLGFLRSLPKCILAVIVCVVVFSILEEAPHDVKFFWKMRAWVDGAMMLLTFVLSLFVSVEVGIIVSVALSLVLCVKQSTSMNIKILGRVPGAPFPPPSSVLFLSGPPSHPPLSLVAGTTYFEELDDLDGADGLLHLQEELPGVLIVRIRDVNLTFANTGAMKERLRRLERYGHRRHHPADEPARAEASVVIFQLVDVGEVDASALQLVAELVESYSARSVLVYWVQCQPRVLARLREAGIIELSGGDSHIQSNIAQALEVLNDTMVTIAGTDGVVV
ncbi:SPOSA6832_00148, partial [Sporobolomyces salmonicolor]